MTQIYRRINLTGTLLLLGICLLLIACQTDDGLEASPIGSATGNDPVSTSPSIASQPTPTPQSSNNETPTAVVATPSPELIPTPKSVDSSTPTPVQATSSPVTPTQTTATETPEAVAPPSSPEPTDVASPLSPTPVRSTATPTPTVISDSTVTITQTPTPTQRPVPTPTTVSNSPTVPAVPPTSTPDPFVSNKKAGANASKYGVIIPVQDPGTISWSLQQLNADWYVNFAPTASAIPAGKSKLLHIQIGPQFPILSVDKLQSIAAEKPGAIWYLGAEPNVSTPVDDMIEDLNYYYTEIARIDPTARTTSPSILNWSFTCVGCGGYESGVSWMTTFLSRYQDLYGESAPWDIWAIDVYPLDWLNLPNTGFTTETLDAFAPNMPPPSESIAAQQIQQYREFIDSLPGKSGQPIIVTELGVHWGWTELEFGVPGCAGASPAGEYRPLVIRDYFESIFTWLENHAASHNIERWFTYVSWSDVNKCRHDGYSGMSLLDAPGTGSQLTDIGRWYVSRSAP